VESPPVRWRAGGEAKGSKADIISALFYLCQEFVSPPINFIGLVDQAEVVLASMSQRTLHK